MADYTLGSLIDEVIEDAKLPTDTTTRARVGRYIRKAHEKVLGHQRFSFNENVVKETLSPGSSPYNPDCDFQIIIQITLTHSTLNQTVEPTYVPADRFFENFPLNTLYPPQAGAPNYYTHFGGEIYWSRPLDVNYVMTMRYQTAPSSLTEEDECPDIPYEFSGVLTEYALAKVEEYRGNFDIGGVHEREFEELSEDLLGRYGLRKRQPGKVKTSKRLRLDA